MSSKPSTAPAAARRLVAKCRTALCKFLSFFSDLNKPDEDVDVLFALYQVRPDALAETFQRVAKNHTLQWSYLAPRVQVEPLTVQIPSEYIGILSYWRGAKLLSQGYLMKQVEHVEKTTLAWILIDSQRLPVPVAHYGSALPIPCH